MLFPSKFQQIHLISISSHSMRRFIHKIYQTVAAISITCQFHGFYVSHFWRIFVTWQHLCSIARSSSIPRSNSLLGRIDLSTANQQFGNLSVYNFSSSHVHFSKLWLIYCHFRKTKTNTLFRYNNMVRHTLVIVVKVSFFVQYTKYT